MDIERAIQAFELVRDIPYRIPLDVKEENLTCLGKNHKLMIALREAGYKVRWRICSFQWSDLRLPPEVEATPHDNNATHAYLEVSIDGAWKAIDATWDKGLAAVFPVAEWDGAGSTVIGVPVKEVYSPEESENIMAALDDQVEYKKAFKEDFKVNGEFYKALNDWLTRVRTEDVAQEEAVCSG